MAMTDIKIKDSDINAVAVHVQVTGDRLTGTSTANKEVFDRYPEMIVSHFNDLCDYVNAQTPEGDAGMSYTATEIARICSALGCTEADLTL
jgi:hypothetical protein